MSDYRLTAIKDRHLDAVHAIYSHYVLHSSATFHIQPPTLEQMRAMVFFNNDRHQTFVIVDDSEAVCGYVLTASHKAREAYDQTAEVTIYLHPDYSGRGLGSQALRHIEAFARTQGLHVLVATICGGNQASIRLFERNGYEQCAHYKEVGKKFGQWLDIIACQKIL
ncbi:MAG: GNAT family N-acetyltransferase [Sporomusaceae bacterium]|nr:GNAT family N-acetyltransferase [Sporomusaceae bacterium]